MERASPLSSQGLIRDILLLLPSTICLVALSASMFAGGRPGRPGSSQGPWSPSAISGQRGFYPLQHRLCSIAGSADLGRPQGQRSMRVQAGLVIWHQSQCFRRAELNAQVALLFAPLPVNASQFRRFCAGDILAGTDIGAGEATQTLIRINFDHLLPPCATASAARVRARRLASSKSRLKALAGRLRRRQESPGPHIDRTYGQILSGQTTPKGQASRHRPQPVHFSTSKAVRSPTLSNACVKQALVQFAPRNDGRIQEPRHYRRQKCTLTWPLPPCTAACMPPRRTDTQCIG